MKVWYGIGLFLTGVIIGVCIVIFWLADSLPTRQKIIERYKELGVAIETTEVTFEGKTTKTDKLIYLNKEETNNERTSETNSSTITRELQ